jgi:pyocin large subunit-like protein
MNLRLGGWPMRRLFLAALAAVAILAYWTNVGQRGERAVARNNAPSSATSSAQLAPATPSKGWGSRVAFVNAQRLDEHYEKHGSEFGRISKQDYLRQAQLLRDASVGGPVLETVRADRVATRYDRQTGAFIAFNPDGTIRTFFKPNDGERYYRRQAERTGE